MPGDLLLAGGDAAAVVVVLALGFQQLAPREEQRAVRADQPRTGICSLPRRLYLSAKCAVRLSGRMAARTVIGLNDPVTHAPYEIHPQSGMNCELYATFATDSTTNECIQRNPSPCNHPRDGTASN